MTQEDTARSLTDRTTNVVLLADTRLEEDLPQLLALGEGPERLLPSFLHEATHYWCFSSPVGIALAMLQMQIHRTAARYVENRDQDLTLKLAASLNRYETAVALLHPLDEGLALFAEFDITTRQDSRVWSQPLELAALFFRRPPVDPQAVDEEMFVTAWGQGLLERMRLGPAILDRKVNVLGLPLTCAGDAYLPGYLLVRQLWLSALRQEWRLASETDLFFMYLRTFLYQDMGLVAILLDSSLDEIQGPNAVLHRVMGRLEQFSQVDPDDLSRFEDAVTEGGDNESSRIAPTIGLTPQDVGTAERLMQEALERQDHEGLQTLDEALSVHESQVLVRRQLLYVGSWKAEVEVADGNFHVSIGGSLVREGPAREGAASGRGPGFVDVLQWVPRRERACAVIREGQVVASESLLMHPVLNDPELLALLGQRDEARERLKSLDDVVDAVVRETWVKVAVEHIRSPLPETIDQMYLPPALADVPESTLERTIAKMSQEGFYPIFDYDRPVIEGFAAIGIACSTLTPYQQWANAFLENRGLSLERTLNAADRAYEEYGVGRIWREAGAILPSV